MIDAVLSYHMNPQTCGVAKWNHALAEHLGVPCLQLDKQPVSHPLVSVKSTETEDWAMTALWYRRFSLFLHDEPHGLSAHDAIRQAHQVYAANTVIAAYVRTIRTDVISGWCPSPLKGDATRGAYRVLAFGMAHKLAVRHFTTLKERLTAEYPDFTVALSTAVHEGSPWDTAMAETVEALRDIFGDRLRVLGFLGDDALAKELEECDAVAVYFDPAVRENNTSVWAALKAGKQVYTNTDRHSPQLLADRYDWPQLLDLLKQPWPACVN